MAVKHWTGRSDLYEFDYDGGAHSPVADEVINVDGEEGDEYATIQCWTVASGAWGTSDAAGKMWVYSASATFITNLTSNDVIEDSGGTKICDTTGGVTAKQTGDWQLVGNWGTGEDPTVPADDDEVIFDTGGTVKVGEGTLDSESGAAAKSQLDLLHFKPQWTYGVGTAAEPVCCAPDKVIIEGSGTYYLLCGEDDQSSDCDVDLVIINNEDAIVYLYSNCNDAANLAEWTKVILFAGELHAAYYSVDTDDTGCYIKDLIISPLEGRKSNATCYVEKDAYDELNDVATNIYMSDGELICDSMVGTFIVDNGTVYYGSELKTGTAVVETDMNITELRMSGGTFYWNPDDSDNDAYIATLHLLGGSINCSNSISHERTRYLGNGAGYDVYIYEGATLNLRTDRGNVSVAASSKLYVIGTPTIYVDSYATLGISYDLP